MVHDACHPDVPLSDWEAFRNEASPYLIERVLDRSETRLPRWFLPLARGAAIASPYLLARAGYRPGSYRLKLSPPWLTGLSRKSPTVAPSGRVRINAVQKSVTREIVVE
jgi:hypothetical protein